MRTMPYVTAWAQSRTAMSAQNERVNGVLLGVADWR
jgi:hypothetical protein